MSFILTHLPHIIAPLLGLAFLARFALYVRRLPPSELSDDELAEWHAQRSGKSQQLSDGAEQPLPR
ncbi:MAG TPA: hypothetical protein VFD61_03495 [Gaiellales bacterium]|nr:hypothetical protein [Gaiellales bacterium]